MPARALRPARQRAIYHPPRREQKAKMPARALRQVRQLLERQQLPNPSKKQKCPPGHYDPYPIQKKVFKFLYRAKSKNARQGITTIPLDAERPAVAAEQEQKAKMPARALRLSYMAQTRVFWDVRAKSKNARQGITTRTCAQPRLVAHSHSASKKQKCPPGHYDNSGGPAPARRMPTRAKSKNARQGITTAAIGASRARARRTQPEQKAKMPARALRHGLNSGHHDSLLLLEQKAKMPARALRHVQNVFCNIAGVFQLEQKAKMPARALRLPGHRGHRRHMLARAKSKNARQGITTRLLRESLDASGD